MLTVLRKSFYALVIAFSSSVAIAQVATGAYNYGTFDNLGVDTINVSNLNAHLSIPVLNKAGRGIPFYYNLSYDSSVWYQITVSGQKTWTPVQNFGWRGDTEIATGYLSVNQSTVSTQRGGYTCYTTTYKNFVYHDPYGIQHPFVGSTVLYTGASQCDLPTSHPTLSALATDGSGYTLNVTNYDVGELTSSSGKQFTPSLNAGTGSASVIDSNGNEISVDNAGHFKDTTGNVVLTVSGNAPSPQSFQYTDTSGNPQTVSMNYQTYTVQTKFNCSGVTEYGPTSTSLVHTIAFPNGDTYTLSYEPTPGVPANVTGRVASIELPQGGIITYSYTGGSNGIECADGSAAGLTRILAASQSSAASTWTYTRTTGAGTSQTAVVDGLGNHKTYTFVAASNQPTPTTDAYYETSRTIKQGASTTVLARNTCYNGATSPCATASFTLPVTQIDTYETLDGIATHGATTKYNTYGAQTEADIYDFGTTTRGALLRQELWTYGYSIPSLPTSDQLIDGISGSEAGYTTFGYDAGTPTTSSGVPQHVPVTGPRGNLTSETIYAGTGSPVSLTTTYEDTGSVLTSVAPTGTTTVSYDSSFVYNTGSSLPTPSSGVAIGTGESYDTTYTGLPHTSTDPNGQATTISTYDSMLRPTVINHPDGGNTVITYDSYGDANQVGIAVAQNASTSTNTQILFDSYGRQGRVAVYNGQSGGADDWYQSDTCYDANGNQQFASYAYQGAGFSGANLNPICSGSGGDTYTYDVLGRLTKIAHGDGTSQTYSYSGRATKVSDENSVTRISQIDGLGRSAIVCEISSNNLLPSGSPGPISCGTDIAGTGFTTTYGYSLSAGTTTVTQGTQTRTFKADWLGRTTSVTEPESGTTTYSYAYNATGLVVTRKRPKANQSTPTVLTTTTTQYDSLGRVVSIYYDDNLTANKSYVYDQNYPGGWAGQNGTNLKGRLAYLGAIVGSNTATHTGQLFSYDPMGRVVGMWECGPSTCGAANQASRPLSYTYDLAGNMKTSTDGGGVTTTYIVSPANEVQSLTSSVSNTTNPANLISNVQNGPNGPNSYSLGNGLTGVNGFDGLGRFNGAWVCNSSNSPICTGGTQIHGEQVALSGVRVTAECDTVLNQCMNYGYDEFNRLTSRTVTSGPTGNFTYGYDRYGNRWSQTGPRPSYSFNTATNQITNTGYGYDAAGNMTNDGIHSYNYDADGNILSVDSGSTATYLYNALNQRVRTVTSLGTTDITFNAAGQRVSMWNGTTGSQIQGQYYWGGTPVAFYKSGAAHFQHQDRQGSERVRTTYNGGVEGSFTFLPFGDAQATYSGSDMDTYHYAQLDHDSETNTDHAQFRQYNNTQGRWMRPDPYSGSYDLFNPQSFNRYSYLLNNPLSMVDPSGLDPCTQVRRANGVRAMEDGGCQGGDDCYPLVSNCDDGGTGDGSGSGEDGGSLPVIAISTTWEPVCDNSCTVLQTLMDMAAFEALFPWKNSGGGGIGNSAPNNLVMTKYPFPANAVPCSTSTGANFMAPPGFNVSNIAANGATNGLSGAGAAVGQFGYYDYQRYVTGPGTFNFYSGYTPVANISVGAYLQGAGYAWASSAISNTYAAFNSSNGATAQQAQFRNLGIALASGKATYSCQSHP